MGLNMFLSCMDSGFVETVVFITATMHVLALQTYLKINSEMFILFISKKFQTD